MNNISQDTTLGAPPRVSDSLEKERWFVGEVHAHDAKLKSYLRGSFPSVDVEDVVQESYLRTWIANAASPVKSAKAFLFTVARHLALNSVQRKRKSPIISMPDLSALDVADGNRPP